TITVADITDDNVVNAAESGVDVDVTGQVAGEFHENDTVTLTVNGVEYTGQVDAGGAWTIAVAGTDLAAATEVLVSVTTTDGAGNRTTATATHGYGVDTEAPELTITVADITDRSEERRAGKAGSAEGTAQRVGEIHDKETGRQAGDCEEQT